MNEERKNTKRLKLEITDIAALQDCYPHAVEKVVVVRENYKNLYKLASAHLTIGKAIPGVTITAPDGRVLGGSAEAAVARHVDALAKEVADEAE